MIDVILIFDIEELDSKERLSKVFIKKGFEEVENLTFISQSSTNLFATKTYLIEMSKEALSKVEFKKAKMIFQLNDFEPECYKFDRDKLEFEKVG